MYAERRLDDPALQQARKAVELVIAGHEPYPALAVDCHWTLVSSNAAVGVLLAGIEPGLLRPPVNVLRLGMHPEGLASRIGAGSRAQYRRSACRAAAPASKAADRSICAAALSTSSG